MYPLPGHMERRLPIRLLTLLLAALLAGSACTSGDLEDLRPTGAVDPDELVADDASDVEPPAKADGSLTGRVGLIIATNSDSWRELVGAPETGGVVVLFVQPGGPSDGSGIERGDVITEVDGEPARNAEHSVVQLRARPNARRTMAVTKADGSTDEITVSAQDPGNVDVKALLDPLIADAPNDPVLRFLRAQTVAQIPGGYEQGLEDANKAVEVEPSFVEALSLRAELRWDRAGALEDQAQRNELRDAALDDWNRALRFDPSNTRVLASRSKAQSQLGNASSGRRDATKALEEDDTFPGAHYAFGVAEFLLKRYGAAAQPAREAIDLNPYDVRYYELLARAFMRTDQPEKAQATIDAIISLVPDGPTKDRLQAIPKGGGGDDAP